MTVHDKIGRQETVDKICGLVDSLQKDQNFCLSLNGAWGSGKTFVLRMIEEQLSKKQEYVIIKYDAWENTFYDDPLIAMLACIIDGVDKKLRYVGRYKEKIKTTAKKGLDILTKISSEMETLSGVVKDIQEIIHAFHNPIDMKSTSDFKSYQKLLREAKEVLNDITQKRKYKRKQTKLIILVDEIDRCLPDEQLKILERMHHLFDVKNCVVIVAMNQDCITKTVHTVYGIDGYEYLRKFFDFTFKVEMLAINYIKSLFGELIQKFDKLTKRNDEQFMSVDFAYQCILRNKKVLENIDNREITRYYQRLLNVCNDFGWDRLIPEYVFFIIVGLYIRKCVSPTFLNEKEIRNNQARISDDGEVSKYSAQNEMTYFDYLVEYLGIDGQKLPDEMNKLPIKYVRYKMSVFFLYFNEIVFYSINKQQYNLNQMRQIRGQPPIFVEDCRKLRDLIILYGGEQERCEK